MASTTLLSSSVWYSMFQVRSVCRMFAPDHEQRGAGSDHADLLHVGFHHGRLQFGRDGDQAAARLYLQAAARLYLKGKFVRLTGELQYLIARKHQFTNKVHQAVEQLHVDTYGRLR